MTQCGLKPEDMKKDMRICKAHEKMTVTKNYIIKRKGKERIYTYKFIVPKGTGVQSDVFLQWHNETRWLQREKNKPTSTDDNNRRKKNKRNRGLSTSDRCMLNEWEAEKRQLISIHGKEEGDRIFEYAKIIQQMKVVRTILIYINHIVHPEQLSSNLLASTQ